MATGGSGDVLTGMVAAWLAQLMDPGPACQLAVYLHGAAGELAEADEGEVSMTAGDIVTPHRRGAAGAHGAGARRRRPRSDRADSRRRTVVDSVGESATRAAAAALAATLGAGDVVLLHGDLGAGKTVFVKGLAEGLGLDPDAVTSPTFTLVHEYAGGRLPLVHLDLYRIDRIDLDDVGFDPALAESGVLVVEWAERLARDVAGAVTVRITDLGGDARRIETGR